jgi:uncharacterized membrane protein (DUF373 family)
MKRGPGESELQDEFLREKTESFFGYVEDFFYIAVAIALTLAGAGLFGYVVYDFVSKIGDSEFSVGILAFLDGLLLVFIITELIHTIRAVIDEKVLVAEPFLIVGIVAAIRRLVVISAEAKDLLGTPEFSDAILEIAVLTGTIVFIAVALFLLRSSVRSEPSSKHEPAAD